MVEKWSAEEAQQALELAEQGLKYSEISAKLGRSENSIRNKLYELRRGGRDVARPYHVSITMSAAEYNDLVTSTQRLKELRKTLKWLNEKDNHYCDLFQICEALVKAYDGHRNTKLLFEKLKTEMSNNPWEPF